MSVQVDPINGFNDPVDVTLGSLPTGFSGNVVGSPVTPPGSVTVDLMTDNTAAEGTQNIQVMATSGLLSHDVGLDIFVRTQPVATVSEWWLNPGLFDANYDFDGNGLIEMIDLVSLLNCYQ